jgi:hypothetical protein
MCLALIIAPRVVHELSHSLVVNAVIGIFRHRQIDGALCFSYDAIKALAGSLQSRDCLS